MCRTQPISNKFTAQQVYQRNIYNKNEYIISLQIQGWSQITINIMATFFSFKMHWEPSHQPVPGIPGHIFQYPEMIQTRYWCWAPHKQNNYRCTMYQAIIWYLVIFLIPRNYPTPDLAISLCFLRYITSSHQYCYTILVAEHVHKLATL